MKFFLVFILALFLLPSPAFAGQEEAQAALGRGDYDAAFPLFQKLAEQGDPAAQYQLGCFYESGMGVKKDDVEAYFWLSLSAKEGYSPLSTKPQRQALYGSLGAAQKEAIDARIAEWKPPAERGPAPPPAEDGPAWNLTHALTRVMGVALIIGGVCSLLSDILGLLTGKIKAGGEGAGISSSVSLPTESEEFVRDSDPKGFWMAFIFKIVIGVMFLLSGIVCFG